MLDAGNSPCLEILLAHSVALWLLQRLLLLCQYLDLLHYLNIVQASRAPPALGSALPGLADGAKAARSQLAPWHSDVLQVEVLPALRGPWPAQQDSSALLLAAGEKQCFYE